jgi:hypothetical protein
MPPPYTSANNPFARFLEEEPRAAFFGQLAGRTDIPGKGRDLLGSASGRRQAEDVYQQAMQGFYGKLGTMALQGQAPTLQFQDYIQGQFPFTERFAQLGRQQSQTSRFRPPTRRLFF